MDNLKGKQAYIVPTSYKSEDPISTGIFSDTLSWFLLFAVASVPALIISGQSIRSGVRLHDSVVSIILLLLLFALWFIATIVRVYHVRWGKRIGKLQHGQSEAIEAMFFSKADSLNPNRIATLQRLKSITAYPGGYTVLSDGKTSIGLKLSNDEIHAVVSWQVPASAAVPIQKASRRQLLILPFGLMALNSVLFSLYEVAKASTQATVLGLDGLVLLYVGTVPFGLLFGAWLISMGIQLSALQYFRAFRTVKEV